ncbi:TPA: hypothetical protein SMN72_003774, partial [Proteus mirabilis]|nr:hypothetical protein [Proteus mirabilis]HEJ9811611.1 hypothetical protein [Proteus mirabilis]
DMALALAAKQDSIKTPEQLMAEIESLYPECLEVAEKQYKKETPPPMGVLLKSTI